MCDDTRFDVSRSRRKNGVSTHEGTPSSSVQTSIPRIECSSSGNRVSRVSRVRTSCSRSSKYCPNRNPPRLRALSLPGLPPNALSLDGSAWEPRPNAGNRPLDRPAPRSRTMCSTTPHSMRGDAGSRSECRAAPRRNSSRNDFMGVRESRGDVRTSRDRMPFPLPELSIALSRSAAAGSAFLAAPIRPYERTNHCRPGVSGRWTT